MDNVFVQLGLVLGLASLFGFFLRKSSVPMLVAYLLVGVVISIFTFFNIETSPVVALRDIGIAFVLFLVGMELDLREIKSLGAPILITGLTQITISSIAGTTISYLFGFRGREAVYLGVGLAFSSTVVIIKLLLEKRDLTSLYGKLAMGITLLEDLVAILILMFFSINDNVLNNGLVNNLPLLLMVVKGVGLILGTYLFSRLILPKIFEAVDSSPELLFLIALTWCFISIAVATALGFSLVIGAFLAGVALASSPFHYHISGKVKPLRDFFIVMFFVYLGSQVGLSSALANLPQVLIFVLYALLMKPLIFSLMLGSFGFRKHTIFQSAIHLTQISEFSLIILLFGLEKGIVGHNALSIMALTVTISITCSSVLIAHSKRIYSLVRPALDFFERKHKFSRIEKRVEEGMEDHIVVVGAHHVGGPIVRFLKREEIPFIVLDFNPDIIEELEGRGVKAIYGDLGDPEVLENLKLHQAKLIISTSNDIDDNKILLEELKRLHSRAKVIIRVEEERDGEELKKRGADYVFIPESMSAVVLVEQLKNHWPEVHFTHLA